MLDRSVEGGVVVRGCRAGVVEEGCGRGLWSKGCAGEWCSEGKEGCNLSTVRILTTEGHARHVCRV